MTTTGAPTHALTDRATTARYAAAGLAAGALGVAVACVLAVLLAALGLGEPLANPVLAVGSAFVERTPSWLKDFAVAAFGTGDKLVLGLGIGLVLAGLFAGVGVLGRARHTVAFASAVALGALALAAVVSRPDAGALAAAPTLVGVGVTLLVLARSLKALRGAGGGGASGSTRRHLLQAGLSVGAALVASVVASRPGGSATASRAAVTLPPLPPATAPGGAVLAVVDADLGLAGVTPWQVPSALFYRIDTVLSPPRLTTAGWSLRVWGEVEQEVTLSWDQLLAKPLVQRWVTLACVSNEVGGDLVGNALWAGWPVRELLALAGPREGADMVLSRSADGWTAGTPLAALTDGRDALLAVAMNGQPLPVEHGFPVRLVVPGLYGYVSATKWVVDLKVTRFAVDRGYWTPRGWSALGPVKLASRVEVPRSGARVAPGRVAVAGTAWAMHRGIQAVQVRVDDGAWQDARLAAQPSIDSWRQWVFEWNAPAGAHTLTVRAQAGDGEWQTDRVTSVAPDGATGHHTVTVQVG